MINRTTNMTFGAVNLDYLTGRFHRKVDGLVGIMITKTDGKKKLTIENADYEKAIELGVCRNGYQTTVVTIDFEMIDWLKEALDEYSNDMVTFTGEN